MAADHEREYRRLATDCLALAQQTSDIKVRAFLAATAQRLLDLIELDERDRCDESLRLRAMQKAVGEELKSLYPLPDNLPVRFLALLSRLDAQTPRPGR